MCRERLHRLAASLATRNRGDRQEALRTWIRREYVAAIAEAADRELPVRTTSELRAIVDGAIELLLKLAEDFERPERLPDLPGAGHELRDSLHKALTPLVLV